MVVRLIAACLGLLLTAASAHAQFTIQYLGASAVPLSNPHDLKLSPDGRMLFVADVGNNRVALLNPETLAMVGSFGADHQSGTHDVDFDAAGRVYVADTHNNRVTVYEMDGTNARLVDEIAGGFRGPEGVLAHPNGRVYVAGAWSGNVIAFQEGKPVAELTGLNSPHDLEVAPNGDIWLADAGNDRMLLLSQDLAILKEVKGKPYDFKGVRYQDVLPSGTVIAADKNSHRVLVFAPDGRFFFAVGSGKPGKGDNLFTTPEGVETDVTTVWISDSGNDRIVKYRMVLP